MNNPMPSPAQPRALGSLNEQPPYEGQPPGRIRDDGFSRQALGHTAPTWRVLKQRGWVHTVTHGQYEYRELTVAGHAALRRADNALRKAVAAELEHDPYAMTQEEYALLRSMVTNRTQPGTMATEEMRRRDYRLRIALEAKRYIEAAPTPDGWRISRAGADALNHREGVAQRDPDSAPRPDRDHTLPYHLRHLIIKAIDEECGQLPFHADREHVRELEQRGLAYRHEPSYTRVLTAAAYVAVGRSTDTERMVRLALGQLERDAPSMDNEQLKAFFIRSCPSGLSVQSFTEALYSLSEYRTGIQHVQQQYQEDYEELRMREQDVYERLTAEAHPGQAAATEEEPCD